MSHLLSLEILGLPFDTVSLVLGSVDVFAAMRLGLSCRQMIRWLDSYEKFWVQKYEESGMELNSFGQIVSAKTRAARAFCALKNLEDPTFNNFSVLERAGSLDISGSMQTGAAFCVSSHQLPGRIHYQTLVDLTQWPKYKVTKLDSPPDGRPPHHLQLLGRKCLDIAPSSNVGYCAINYDIEHLFSDPTATTMSEDGRGLNPTLPAGAVFPMHHAVLSSDPELERVAFLMPTNDKNWFICVHDVPTGHWSPAIAIDSLVLQQGFQATSPRFPKAQFNGNHIILWDSSKFVVVKFSGADLRPELVGAVSCPPDALYASNDSISVSLSTKYMLVYYHVAETVQVLTDAARLAKLLKINLDSLQLEASFTFPQLTVFPFLCHLSVCGSIAALSYVSGVMLIDFKRDKILRKLQCPGASSARLVDSSLLVIFARSTIVVDFLARAQVRYPAVPEPLLYCWNTKKEELHTKSVSLDEIRAEVLRLLLCKNSVVRGAPGSAISQSVLRKVFIFYRKPAKKTDMSCPMELHYIATHLQGIFTDAGKLFCDELPPLNKDIFNDIQNREESDDIPDMVFFNLAFDDSDPVMPRLVTWSLEEAKSFIPELLKAKKSAETQRK